MERTEQAIEGLYSTFAKYRLGKHVAGCPCCVTREDEQTLMGRPLRELTSDDLTRFAFSALSTWGDANHFRHFLPRICELLVAPRASRLLTDAQTIFSKLPYARWTNWPEEEQQAVTCFMRQTWLDLLSAHPPSRELDTWLECAGIVEGTVEFYLGAFSEAPSCAAASHVADLVQARTDEVFDGAIRWIWWQPDQDEIVPWLRGAVARDVLTRAFEENLEHGQAHRWATTLDTLSLLTT